ncbi:hypothetical protein [Sodalis sp. C49]|uniref:hypothetical protein n=1 Tax=unclassified Sodalis (in: enterobacteria) TaxID=2636512 RepID=UPI0039659F06
MAAIAECYPAGANAVLIRQEISLANPAIRAGNELIPEIPLNKATINFHDHLPDRFGIKDHSPRLI